MLLTTSPTRTSARTAVAVATAVAGLAIYFIPLSVLVTVLMAGAGIYAWRRLHPAHRLRHRLGAAGWLARRELRQHAGARAMRTHAGVPRPGLGVRRRSLTTYGARVGTLVSGPVGVCGRAVYSPWSRGILVLGPQGSGKTSWLVGPILDAPGAAYVTSTKTELADLTAQLRARRGPVHVFNPTGLGGLASTFCWDPVAACVDPAIADARARALVRGGGGVPWWRAVQDRQRGVAEPLLAFLPVEPPPPCAAHSTTRDAF